MLTSKEKALRHIKWQIEQVWMAEKAALPQEIDHTAVVRLGGRDQWLDDSVLDAYTNLVIKRYLEYPEQYPPAFRYRPGSNSLSTIEAERLGQVCELPFFS